MRRPLANTLFLDSLTDNIEYSLQQYAAMTQAQLLNAPHLQQQQHTNNDRQQSSTQSSPMSHLQDPNHAFSLAYQPFSLIRMAPPQLHQPTLAKDLSPSTTLTTSTSLDLGMNAKSARPTRVTRPPNAYLLFNKEMRRILKDQDPTMKVADISKEVGFRWKSMPKVISHLIMTKKDFSCNLQEQKEQYVNQANKIKEEQRALHPNSMYIRRSRAELLKAGHFSKGNPDQPADSQIKRKRPKRDKNTTTPKHPLSAYMWYLTEVRPDVMRQYPGSNVGQISKLCADRWNVMSEEARLPWKTKAQVDKDRYAREMQIYAIQNDHALGRGTRQKYRSAAAALRRDAAAITTTTATTTTTSSSSNATADMFLGPLFYSNTATTTGKPPSYLSAPTSPTSLLRTTLPMAQHTLNPHALLQQQQQQHHQHSNSPSTSTSTSSNSTLTHSSTSTVATVYSDHRHC
ncbi:C. briggsae CBR-HMG-1.2 protein [Mucor ambiguus]|uniref:C. briggsae CBR-HMG-1.2 protein n=1 Tax=Mucor ambiguus TaxID=91626 RepID=A0A0C9MAQ6_9FUNG|nr:C. briggsae CBR-HMG-1.2 protein [Mucor ambiguus]